MSAAATRVIPSQQYLDFANDHFRGDTYGGDGNGGSWGNGAVMSFTPGVILSRGSKVGLLAEAASELAGSHRHPTAMVGATLLKELLEQVHAGKVQSCSELPQAVLHCPSWTGLVQPLEKSPCNYMHPISAFTAFLTGCNPEVQLVAAQEFIKSLNSSSVVSGVDHCFGPLGEALRVAANFDDDTGERLTVKDNPKEFVKFSQRGLNSVLIAIWCAVGAENCWDWLEKVLYIGGDSDTIGAVAGQIACPLLSASEVVTCFRNLVGLDNHFLSSLHEPCHAAARRYFHRAVLFASGRWAEMLNVPRLVDPYYEGITEMRGVRLLHAPRVQCKFGKSCAQEGLLHKDRCTHPGEENYEKIGRAHSKDTHGAQNQSNDLRKRCKHGSSCYDKSRQHRERYAHPEDPDYEFSVFEAQSSQKQRRISCKHCARCYNQDTRHRAAYAHPGDADFKS